MCPPIGGKGMVGSGGIIAGTFRSIIAQENRTRIDHLLGQFSIILSDNDQVLGGIVIDHVHHFLLVIHQDHLAVIQSFGRNIFPGKKLQLLLQLYFHPVDQIVPNRKSEGPGYPDRVRPGKADLRL